MSSIRVGWDFFLDYLCSEEEEDDGMDIAGVNLKVRKMKAGKGWDGRGRWVWEGGEGGCGGGGGSEGVHVSDMLICMISLSCSLL